MSTRTKLLTPLDLMAMGEDARYELIRGALRDMSPTKLRHVKIAGRFAAECALYSARLLPGLVVVGETGLFAERDPDTVIVPDVAFHREDRVPYEDDEDDYARVPPDAVVEVKSPSNTEAQLTLTIGLYLRKGVRLALVSDPDDPPITAHTPDGSVRTYRIGENLDGGHALPGFRAPVERCFHSRPRG
jgi:Uma2 family endonuclease